MLRNLSLPSDERLRLLQPVGPSGSAAGRTRCAARWPRRAFRPCSAQGCPAQQLAQQAGRALDRRHSGRWPDAGDTDRLGRLVFSDLHLRVGGRIFAMNDAVVPASMASGQFWLIELSLLLRLRKFLPLDSIWQASQFDLAVIMLAPLQRKLAGEAR